MATLYDGLRILWNVVVPSILGHTLATAVVVCVVTLGSGLEQAHLLPYVDTGCQQLTFFIQRHLAQLRRLSTRRSDLSILTITSQTGNRTHSTPRPLTRPLLSRSRATNAPIDLSLVHNEHTIKSPSSTANAPINLTLYAPRDAQVC